MTISTKNVKLSSVVYLTMLLPVSKFGQLMLILKDGERLANFRFQQFLLEQSMCHVASYYVVSNINIDVIDLPAIKVRMICALLGK